MPRLPQLREQLGLSALRVLRRGVSVGLCDGARRRYEDRAGAGGTALVGGRPTDASRAQADRSTAARYGAAHRRPFVRLCRHLSPLSGRQLYPSRRESVPSSRSGASFARSVRIRRRPHGTRTFRHRVEMGRRGAYARIPDARLRIFPQCGTYRMERIRAVFNWSGGKDSAHALWRAMRSGDYEIVALLTTVDGSTRRSTMHGIPAALLQAQAERIGIPLYRLDLAPNGDMADYGAAMSRAVAHFGARGVTHFIFGDIFLHDVRAYRERQLAPFGIEVVEPLWGESSQEVMADFLASGLKTVVVTTMDDGLGRAAVGRVVDRDFVASLPAGTDPNGENGEYHTFCYDGPIFASPVPFRLGTPFSRSYDVRLDDGTSKSYAYWFADLREA